MDAIQRKIKQYFINKKNSKQIINQTYPYNIQFLNLEGKNANKQNVESYLKKQNPRLLLFHGHGDNKTIFGFKDEVLIEMNNNDFLLKDKIVYSLTCDSAKELGVNAVKNGIEAFIGYKAPFVIFNRYTKRSKSC